MIHLFVFTYFFFFFLLSSWAIQILSLVFFYTSTQNLNPRSFFTSPHANASKVNMELRRLRQRHTLAHLSAYFFLTSLAFLLTTWIAWEIYSSGKEGETGVSFYLLSLLLAQTIGSSILASSSILIRSTIAHKGLQRKKRTTDGPIPSPEPDASYISQLTFSWFDPLMAQGYESTLSMADIWDVYTTEEMNANMKDYVVLTEKSQLASKSLLYSLYKLNEGILWWQWLVVMVSTALFFSGPYFLRCILLFLEYRGLNVYNYLYSKKTHGDDDTKPIPTPLWIAYMYVMGMLVSSVLRFLLDNHIMLLARKIGFRLGNVLCGLIYQKSLRRLPKLGLADLKKGKDPSAVSSATVGTIVNLMSVDANKVANWAGLLYTPLITLIQIVLCISSLCVLLGWPALAGVITMLVFTVLGWPLASKIQGEFYGMKLKRDARVNGMNELLQGIKIVKLFAWEDEFYERIEKLRQGELYALFLVIFLSSLNRVLWYSAPIVTTFVTLGSYTKLFGNELDATTAFTALSLFNLLRGPLQAFPDTVVQLLDVWVSFKRVRDFLGEEELEEFMDPTAALREFDDKQQQQQKLKKKQGSDKVKEEEMVMGFKNAWFEWSETEKVKIGGGARAGSLETVQQQQQQEEEEDHVFGLSNLNVSFPAEKLTTVIGATGSGKTSLLLALLGEMRRISGGRKLPTHNSSSSSPNNGAAGSDAFGGSKGIAYVPQTAWLTNSTIRENILFGSEFDPTRYSRVVRACALLKDFEELPGGDQTEIGEQGINLSGGQKQRISLARAAYSTSQFVLLDDPLSAVDAPTARHLFEQCICGFMEGRTRVLVTNAAGLALPGADRVVVLGKDENGGGMVESQGGLEEVLEELRGRRERFERDGEGAGVSAFVEGVLEMGDLAVSERYKILENVRREKEEEEKGEYSPLSVSGEKKKKDGEYLKPWEEPLPPTFPLHANAETEAAKQKSKLTTDEKMEQGAVSNEVYMLYIVAMGGFGVLGVVLFGYIFNHSMALLQDFIVGWWTEAYKRIHEGGQMFMFSSGGGRAPGQAIMNVQGHGISSWSLGMGGGGGGVLGASFAVIPNIFQQSSFAASTTLGAFSSNDNGTVPEIPPVNPVEAITNKYLIFFAIAGVLCMFSIFTRLMLLMISQYWAAQYVHNKLMRKILRAPLRFFEVTPLGRIMNRFSKDVVSVDFEVGVTTGNTVYSKCWLKMHTLLKNLKF
jgi:ABC-type multidrug transport system fused ATPase/permease subunit